MAPHLTTTRQDLQVRSIKLDLVTSSPQMSSVLAETYPNPSFRRSCSLPGCSACWEEVYGAAGAYDLTEGAWRFSWKTWISLSWAALVSVSIRRALGLPRSAG